jgi:glyoxylase-like metal-dependent hydrolase (beta-lactamase superfamily II)
MDHGSLRVDGVEVAVVCEGYAPIDLAEELPTTDVDWVAERAAHPWAFHDETSWAWHVHAFALRTPDGVVLVDTGTGPFPPYRPWAVEVNPGEALGAAGLAPGEVVAVVHTHLHADHAGGAVVEGEPRFPNAVHHVHPADWSFFAVRDGPSARGAMEVLEERGALDLRADDHEVVAGVRVVHAPGHTPGHRTVVAGPDDDAVLLVGDLLHTTPQVRLPGAPSSHDEDPEAACRSRERALGDARDLGWWVGVSHFGRPFGHVDEQGWRSA